MNNCGRTHHTVSPRVIKSDACRFSAVANKWPKCSRTQLTKTTTPNGPCAPYQFEPPPMAINHTHNALTFIAFIDDLTCDLFRVYRVADYEF